MFQLLNITWVHYTQVYGNMGHHETEEFEMWVLLKKKIKKYNYEK